MGRALEVVVCGAGNRGFATYGEWARAHPDRLRVVAFAEPDADRRAHFAARHGIAAERTFASFEELFARPRLASAAIVATPDTLHVRPALAALEAGYDVLLEKPIAPDPGGCEEVVVAAEQAGRLLQIAHPLRFTPFYRNVHQIVTSGRLGRVHTLDLREHVAHWHMSHSYVRGKFRNRAVAAPLILAKACHDLDLLLWLSASTPRRVASFAELSHYRAGNAPAGAPERCSDGCPAQPGCPHDAVAFYLGPDPERARGWPFSDVSLDPSREARRRALETGPYGRCVFHADNDVVDHQVSVIELYSGALATFGVHGLATRERRTIRLSGSRGELRGVLQEGVIEVSRHGEREVETLRVASSASGHHGGDEGLLDHFVTLARSRRDGEECGADESALSGRTALAAHLLGFAAERARLSGQVQELGEAP